MIRTRSTGPYPIQFAPKSDSYAPIHSIRTSATNGTRVCSACPEFGVGLTVGSQQSQLDLDPGSGLVARMKYPLGKQCRLDVEPTRPEGAKTTRITMARRRDRRGGPSADHRLARLDVSNRQNQLNHSNADRKLMIIFTIFFIALPGVSILVYRMKYPPQKETARSYISQNPLVKADVSYLEILAEHSKLTENATQRSFVNPVLAYVTPWNSRGYELAKRFSSRLTHISPVWYEVKSHEGTLVLEGRHNADMRWISDLRIKSNIQILPRVILEANPKDFLRKKKQRSKAIQLIVAECRDMGYDGVVLESWSRWMAYGILHDPNLRALALQFIQDLGHEIHSASTREDPGQRLQLIYVIGPPRSEKVEAYDFGPKELQGLSNAVDGFSLMTYDFSGPHSPGPNAPLNWIRNVMNLLLGTKPNASPILAPKIFLGINFYGNDFVLPGGVGGGAIIGADYLSLLEKHRPSLRWEKNSAEHFFLYSDENKANHAVFYPSLLSIFMRLEEAHSRGTGISIWEIGQGLDYFFDIL
ncbi:hypothetical protein SAY86_020193 [Trapa natans]|uniref:Chitinase domain-containing protein 1 n=1 Tax=Trapa natans TaxID=22666 RepID=A0AAN7LPE5_TRANT|nr:hypothetical protein SAY86_020193 [Trapa natans]